MSRFLTCLAIIGLGIAEAFSDPVDHLVSYWPFENNVADQASAGSTFDNATWTGISGFISGPHGQAIFLDGANHLTIPASLDINRTGSDMSLSAWFQIIIWDTEFQCMVAKGEGNLWRINRQGGDPNAIAFAGGSGAISGGAVNDGQWHHLVAVSEAGVSTRLFIDGVLVATGASPEIADGPGPVFIGDNPDSPGRRWKGAVDDLGIFEIPLNNHQVAAIYALSRDSGLGYFYDLKRANQLIAAHTGGPGTSVTITDTYWEYVSGDPADGRDFLQMAADGSGIAGSPGPGIRHFSADHPLIPPGSPVTLSWEITGSPVTLTIDQGIGDVLPITTNGLGSLTLDPGPFSNTTYTLTTSNSDGSNTRAITVGVTPNPIIEFFTASNTITAPDTPVTLNWNVLNATSILLNGDDVTGIPEITLTPPGTTNYTLTANNAQGSTTANLIITVIIPGEPVISEFSADADGSFPDEDNAPSDWIEIYNPGPAIAILADYYLTDDPDRPTKWRLPDTILDPLTYLVIFASGKDRAVAGSELHTNFSLRASGEYLALTKQTPSGILILNEFNPFPFQPPGYSFGLNPAGTNQGYFQTPSPGANNGPALSDYVRDTGFSIDRGFYEAPFSLEITTSTPDARIHYTTDGSDPTPSNGILYTGPINITGTTVVKAMASRPGLVPTNVDAQTYIFLADVLTQTDSPPGYPAGIDFGMDPDVVNHPAYQNTIQDDLKSIPSLSLSMPVSSLFGSSGIYTNAENSGLTWERAGSVEFIYPDGSTDHQVNCGVRMQGGVGREADFPKHSFRLLFKRPYGDTKLRFPLFRDATEDAEGAVDTFDTIILRAGYNNSWHRGSPGEEARAQYLRDQFLRNSQLAMGQASSHGTFFHLYLNGLYWGVYNAVERPNADFGSSYCGGKKEDWDSLNSYPRNIVDGTADDWTRAHAIANAGVASQAGYDALSQYLDIPNLIDYMLVNFYGGNLDWDDHNWYAINPRIKGGGYKFVCWDSELTLVNVESDNRTGVGQADKPSGLYSQLRANPEFRLQFADRAHKHLFNNGALAPAQSRSRFLALSTHLDRAIVGESARWGDSKRATPYTRNIEWVAERDRLLDSYLPARSDVTLDHLRGAGLYPNTDAPVFSQQGGHLTSTTPLTMSTTTGTIYYTINGSDPRLPGGGINPAALPYESPLNPLFLTETTTLRARALDSIDWSALNEAYFIIDSAVAHGQNLVISELHYRPSGPNPAEEAAGFTESSDFEYIEVTNIDGIALDLTNVRFTLGVTFNFNDSPNGLILPAGQRLLLVNNTAAFMQRYPGVPASLIAGEFNGNLSNDGEPLALLAGDGSVIRSFTYNDKAPWPESADGEGFSLVLVNPTGNPDHADPRNWRASVASNGTPGGSDATVFSGNALADLDGDGSNALLEYAFQSSDTIPRDSLLPGHEIISHDFGTGPVAALSLSFLRNLAADDLIYTVQLSHDLNDWDTNPGDLIYAGSQNNGDGTSLETYLMADSVSAEARIFLRLKVSLRE